MSNSLDCHGFLSKSDDGRNIIPTVTTPKNKTMTRISRLWNTSMTFMFERRFLAPPRADATGTHNKRHAVLPVRRGVVRTLPALLCSSNVLMWLILGASLHATVKMTMMVDGAIIEDVIQEPEYETGYIQTLRVQLPPIYETNSKHQKISIYESSLPNSYYGKIFVLDECLQLTERDASHYNEILAHVPLLEYQSFASSSSSSSPSSRKDDEEIPNDDDDDDGGSSDGLRVLVLGGGDGYVVSELLKHPSVGRVDHVELDASIIEASLRFFPWATEELWNNHRVGLFVQDGAEFVKARSMALKASKTKDNDETASNNENVEQDDSIYAAKDQLSLSYHVIIQDSSDPFFVAEDGETITKLPSSVLYTEEHFQNMYSLLEPTNGVLLFQAESYNVPSSLKEIYQWRKSLQRLGFSSVRYGSIAIGTYPTGQIGFLIGRAGGEGGTCDTSEATTSEANKENGINGVADIIEKAIDMDVIQKGFDSMHGDTLYYHPRIHRSSYDLPLWVEKYIYGEHDEGQE